MYDALFTEKQSKRDIDNFNYLMDAGDDYSACLLLESMMKKAEKKNRFSLSKLESDPNFGKHSFI